MRQGHTMSDKGDNSALIGAVDQGTSSTRFLVFDSKDGYVVDFHQEEAHRICPQEGWTEMDPMWIIESVKRCIDQTMEKLTDKGVDPKRIKCVGISNQMLTCIPWDKLTGKPLYNAIEWSDVRTHKEYEAALDRIPNRNKDHFRERTGVPFTAIFLYTKIPWLMNNVPEVRKAISENRCYIGTVDSWLLWNLTGGPNGGKYMTEVTNASCTGLLNLHDLKWDTDVCKFFDIPYGILPEIRSSSEIYGYIKDGPLEGIPISGILGDQLGAITGQQCFKPGESKCTYGTAGCINVNTGTKPCFSTHGLMTMPQFQLGPGAQAVYCVMGPVQGVGEMIGWMRDNLKMIDKPSDIERYASNVDSTHDCFFVPAFDGLFCPYWEDDARGTIVGMTAYTTRDHICRAALESICFQIKDVLHSITVDTGFSIPNLRVDGGMTVNNLLMQIQTDFTGIQVVRPKMKETTSFGAALVAGAADGVNIFRVSEDRLEINVHFEGPTDVFNPKMSVEERDRLSKRWKKAIEKSKHWLAD